MMPSIQGILFFDNSLIQILTTAFFRPQRVAPVDC